MALRVLCASVAALALLVSCGEDELPNISTHQAAVTTVLNGTSVNDAAISRVVVATGQPR